MRGFRLFPILMLVVSLLFLPACANDEEADVVPPASEAVESGVEQEEQELDPRFEVWEGYTVEQREEFGREVETLAQEYDTWISNLEEQAASQTDETVRTGLNEQIAGLRQQRELLQEQLDQIGTASAEEWEDLKLGIMTAIETFEQSFEEAASSVG